MISRTICPNVEAFLELLKPFKHIPRRKIHCVYEAGCFGFWIAQRLRRLGYDCHITPPSLIPVESGNRVKTDKKDSKKLAIFLAKGLLRSIYIPEEKICADREITRTREQLVRHRANIERQIKSKLLLTGIGSEYVHRGPWTGPWVKQIQLWVKGSQIEVVIQSLLSLREQIVFQIGQFNQKITELAEEKRYQSLVAILKSTPGIGLLYSMIFLIEMGNELQRFSNAKKFVAYLGLTPSEHSSGNHIHRGSITRTGNKRIRSALVEASWIAIRHDSYLADCYQRIKIRRGAQRAIIAVARRLALKLRRMILNKEPYKKAA